MVWEIIKKIILAGIVSWELYNLIKLCVEWKDWISNKEFTGKNNMRYYKDVVRQAIIFSANLFILLVWLILFF